MQHQAAQPLNMQQDGVATARLPAGNLVSGHNAWALGT